MYDIHDLENPKALGWARLPKVKADFSPVAGLAISEGRVYLAGAFDDLHLVHVPVAKPVILPQAPVWEMPSGKVAEPSHGLPAYVVEGSIRNVVAWRDDLALVAAGSAGWHIVRVLEQGFEPIAQFQTDGFVRDLAVHGDRVFVAESLGGLSVWERNGEHSFKRLSQFRLADQSIHQVVLLDDGTTAFLAVGATSLYAVKIHEDGKIEQTLGPERTLGLFYRDPFSPVSPVTQSFLAQWHVTGLLEYGVRQGAAVRKDWTYAHRMGTGQGAFPLEDGWLITASGGYVVVKHGELISPQDLGIQRLKGVSFYGKPSIVGQTLFVSDPLKGDVTALEVSNPKEPKLLGQLKLSGHPGRVKSVNGILLIPAGREGLLQWKIQPN